MVKAKDKDNGKVKGYGKDKAKGYLYRTIWLNDDRIGSGIGIGIGTGN